MIQDCTEKRFKKYLKTFTAEKKNEQERLKRLEKHLDNNLSANKNFKLETKVNQAKNGHSPKPNELQSSAERFNDLQRSKHDQNLRLLYSFQQKRRPFLSISAR